MSPGRLQLLVLLPEQARRVRDNIEKRRSNNYYEVALVRLAGVRQQKPATAYVFVTDKHLIIKEYYLRVIPHRLATYRVCPAVKMAVR